MSDVTLFADYTMTEDWDPDNKAEDWDMDVSRFLHGTGKLYEALHFPVQKKVVITFHDHGDTTIHCPTKSSIMLFHLIRDYAKDHGILARDGEHVLRFS